MEVSRVVGTETEAQALAGVWREFKFDDVRIEMLRAQTTSYRRFVSERWQVTATTDLTRYMWWLVKDTRGKSGDQEPLATAPKLPHVYTREFIVVQTSQLRWAVCCSVKAKELAEYVTAAHKIPSPNVAQALRRYAMETASRNDQYLQWPDYWQQYAVADELTGYR